MEEEKLAVDSGFWQLYRFHPEKEFPLTLDCKPPIADLKDFFTQESRFKGLDEETLLRAEKECKKRRELYEYLAKFPKA
jgi:pyruvate-ferredoxin/flavodoxin oxidoreductase